MINRDHNMISCACCTSRGCKWVCNTPLFLSDCVSDHESVDTILPTDGCQATTTILLWRCSPWGDGRFHAHVIRLLCLALTFDHNTLNKMDPILYIAIGDVFCCWCLTGSVQLLSTSLKVLQLVWICRVISPYFWGEELSAFISLPSNYSTPWLRYMYRYLLFCKLSDNPRMHKWHNGIVSWWLEYGPLKRFKKYINYWCKAGNLIIDIFYLKRQADTAVMWLSYLILCYIVIDKLVVSFVVGSIWQGSLFVGVSYFQISRY